MTGNQLAIPQDFGNLSEAVLDIDMAQAVEKLNERAFDLKALDLARQQLLDVQIGGREKKPKDEPLHNLRQVMSDRWPLVAGLPSAEQIEAYSQRVFSNLIGPDDDQKVEDIRDAAKQSLIVFHPDKGATANAQTASILGDVAESARSGKLSIGVGTENETQVIKIDSDVSKKLAIQKSLLNVIQSLAIEVNNPEASVEALGQAYNWLDLTSSVPSQFNGVLERVRLFQKRKPVDTFLFTIGSSFTAIDQLMGDAGGFRIYDMYDRDAFDQASGYIERKIPRLFEQINEILNDETTVEMALDTWGLSEDQQATITAQVIRLAELVASGQTISSIYTAGTELREIVRHLEAALAKLNRAEDREETQSLNMIGGIAVRSFFKLG